MPTSVPFGVPIVASVARQIRPRTVLDVGIGFGKYGFLFREYLDIWDMECVGDYDRSKWKTTIEGIEATPYYLTPLHQYIYDKIYTGDVLDIIDTLGQYDVIIMGDVLEHFPKETGVLLLDKLLAHTDKCLLLTFPPDCKSNDNVLGNHYESHRSAWNRRDFRRFENAQYKQLEARTALVAISKPPTVPPILTPCFGVRRRTGWKGILTSFLVRTLGWRNASRIGSWICREPVVLRT